MVNLDFLGKRLGIVSPVHSVYEFSKKMFLVFYQLTKFHYLIAFFFLQYWGMCVLQLFVSQVFTS